MEQNIKMPANFAEMSEEEMAYTEGGHVRVTVTNLAGVLRVRKMGRIGFANYVFSQIGASRATKDGNELYGRLLSSYDTFCTLSTKSILFGSRINGNVIIT